MNSSPDTNEPLIDSRRAGFDTMGTLLFSAAAFQCLRASCETGLLDALAAADAGMSSSALALEIGVSGRWLDILLTGAAATNLIHRDDNGIYRLPDEIGVAVRSAEWKLFKAAVAFEQYITYPGIHHFTESLINCTNAGITAFPGTPGQSLYERLEDNPELREVFYTYMGSWSHIGRPVLLRALRGLGMQNMLDVGGGDAVNSIAAVQEHPSLKATVLDILPGIDVARRAIDSAGLSDRIAAVQCDIFSDPFPLGHDIVLFAHQLVIWAEDDNRYLLQKANQALPVGGHVVVFSSMTNDSEDGPLIAGLASVYHACIPVEGGRIYPWSSYEKWLAASGFGNARRITSTGWTPHGAVVAEKVSTI